MKYPYCAECGSLDVNQDCTAYWARGEQTWKIGGDLEVMICGHCGEETTDGGTWEETNDPWTCPTCASDWHTRDVSDQDCPECRPATQEKQP